jgi:hypothetical protein
MKDYSGRVKIKKVPSATNEIHDVIAGGKLESFVGRVYYEDLMVMVIDHDIFGDVINWMKSEIFGCKKDLVIEHFKFMGTQPININTVDKEIVFSFDTMTVSVTNCSFYFLVREDDDYVVFEINNDNDEVILRTSDGLKNKINLKEARQLWKQYRCNGWEKLESTQNDLVVV